MDFDSFSSAAADSKRQGTNVTEEEDHYDVIHSSEALIAEFEQSSSATKESSLLHGGADILFDQQEEDLAPFNSIGGSANSNSSGNYPAPSEQQTSQSSSYSLLDDDLLINTAGGNSISTAAAQQQVGHVGLLKSEPAAEEPSSNNSAQGFVEDDGDDDFLLSHSTSAADTGSSAPTTFEESTTTSSSSQQLLNNSLINGTQQHQADKQPSPLTPNLDSFRGEEHSERPPVVTTKVEEKPTSTTTTVTKPKVTMEGDAVPSTTSNKGCPFTSGSWWDPTQLHPLVEELIYWRNIRKSGTVFGTVLLLLLSLTYFSLISVFAYAALAALSVAIAFRIYKNVLQAVQKSSEGHPFKEYLEKDISLPSSRVHEAVDVLMKHGDHLTSRLRSLFLVEDLVDSLKLALLLWFLTYVGAWFNGMTLIILGYVALFTLPKVYETYKAEIDQYLDLAKTQVGGVLANVRAKIPIGKKAKEQ